MTFRVWAESPQKFNKLKKTLYTKQGFENYRHISHKQILEYIETMEFDYPRQVMIPKDAFSEREVFLYKPWDNLVLKLYNMYLNEVFQQDISEHVYSYMEGVSVATVLSKFYKVYDHTKTYVKIDLTNYFMTPSGEQLTNFLRKYQLTEAPFNKLFENKYYGVKSKILEQKNLGLLPGAPVSAFLANAYLYDFDNYMAANYPVFFRYSDDFVIECGDKNPDAVVLDIAAQLQKVGLNINQKKTEIFKDGRPVNFLGSEFSQKGYQLNRKRLNKIKKTIKKMADVSAKINKPADERIQIFLQKVYHFFFSNITKNIFRGGVCAAWFSCTNVMEQFQAVDYYILDKCRYVYSRKTNFGALKHGINTEYLSKLGVVSLVTRWKQYKEHPLAMSLNAFLHLDSFKKAKSKDWYMTRPYGISGSFDFMDLLLSGSDAPFDITKWKIDPYNKQITLGEQLLLNSNQHEFYFDDCRVYLEEDYGEISAEEFINIYRTSSFKSTEFKKTH